MAFRMFCHCGPGPHEVLAERVRYYPTGTNAPWRTDRRGMLIGNRCVECKKIWPAPQKTRRRRPLGQTEFNHPAFGG